MAWPCCVVGKGNNCCVIIAELKTINEKPIKKAGKKGIVIAKKSRPEPVLFKADEPATPFLTRLLTRKTYCVDTPVFRVGAEQSCCELAVENNDYISRNHANIITRHGKYFIVDRNSTNKTFVNGVMIPPEQEVEIFNGTQLRIANEEFIFELRIPADPWSSGF